MNLKGNCMCGEVEFSAEVPDKHFDCCHCSMCRKWGGGPAFTVNIEGEIAFSNPNSVKTYDSSEWAQRGFCGTCGTHLFYRLKDNSFWNVPMGILKDTSGFEFKTQIFIDSKPDNYEFLNETAKLTEAEVLQAFSEK